MGRGQGHTGPLLVSGRQVLPGDLLERAHRHSQPGLRSRRGIFPLQTLALKNEGADLHGGHITSPEGTTDGRIEELAVGPPDSLPQRPHSESPLQSMGAVTTSYKGEDP